MAAVLSFPHRRIVVTTYLFSPFDFRLFPHGGIVSKFHCVCLRGPFADEDVRLFFVTFSLPQRGEDKLSQKAEEGEMETVQENLSKACAGKIF